MQKINPAAVVADAGTMSATDIANKYGVTPRRIQQVLKAFNVRARGKTQHKEKSEHGYVYRVTVGNACYIGQTTDLQQRMQVHKHDLQAGKHSCHYLQAAYNQNPDAVRLAFDAPTILQEFTNVTTRCLLDAETQAIMQAAAAGDNVCNGLLGDVLLYKMKHPAP